MPSPDRATRLFWSTEQDRAQFGIAIRRLKQLEDDGETLPLHFTLPTGRSIESLCDRVARLQGGLPSDLLKVLNDLAVAVAVPQPTINSYGSCAPVVREICKLLALPVDQRGDSKKQERPPWFSHSGRCNKGTGVMPLWLLLPFPGPSSGPRKRA
jgi:hypothetical protein